jgi:3-hydroxyisobutyrate dehydrogenase-like beta-hydroxyacid dehydrogenase
LKQKIGFIGVETMGKSTATNLVKGGYQMVVRDINPKPAEELKDKGAGVARSGKDIA